MLIEMRRLAFKARHPHAYYALTGIVSAPLAFAFVWGLDVALWLIFTGAPPP